MRKFLLPALADVVAVLVFCAIGRRSHAESGALVGLAHTAWPFLGGLAIGWGVSLAVSRDRFAGLSLVPTGVIVWFATLTGGMLLRVADGQGVAVSFVIVAATVLAVFLLGWRAISAFVERRGRGSSSAEGTVRAGRIGPRAR